jgi:hypothetical protein
MPRAPDEHDVAIIRHDSLSLLGLDRPAVAAR